jgi:hypothetical protein
MLRRQARPVFIFHGLYRSFGIVIPVGLFVPLWCFRSSIDSADLRGFFSRFL